MSYSTIAILALFAVAAFPQSPAPVPAPEKAPAPQVNSPRMRTAAQRNENVAVNRIDNNAVKEANVRLGAQVTIVSEPKIESTYWAAEVGSPPSPQAALAAVTRHSSWHADLFAQHQNSVFNARTFFQVGEVQPSRRNIYGARWTGNAGPAGFLTIAASQRKIRGMVNGNVLVPLEDEREPTATDPAVRDVISGWLKAYPTTLPNRPDFDQRALNTNAPQSIDEVDPSVRLDRSIGNRNRVAALYSLARSRTSAFQLVAGQNPNMDIHSHRAQLSWHAEPSADTIADFGFTFQRTASALVPEPNAASTRVRIGYQIEELGPDAEFPIDRAQNSFRYGGAVSRRLDGGKHNLVAGGDLVRFQLNSVEATNQRGYYSFTNNFGRSAIQNFLFGTPSYYEITIGDLPRGYRTWAVNGFVSDRWKISNRLEIYYGLRYGLVTAPTEVNHRDEPPYACDCNNFSPRFALAAQLGQGWALRTSYSVSFAQIQPVTYQQVRNNLPLVRSLQVQNPDLLNPLAGIDLGDPNGRSGAVRFSRDMVSPYSHQYNLRLERKLGPAIWRVGYVGSRSFKLISAFTFNRADPVPGIPQTLDTVDRRRADQRYYEVQNPVNAGIAYFDAGQTSLDLPNWHGLQTTVSYTFGKGIDQGSDYTATAANRDLSRGRNQWQYEYFGDKKGWSNFDSTHAFQATFTYDLPRPAATGHWQAAFVNGWQLSGVTLWKTGTPLTLFTGSDAPGFGNVDGGPSDRPNIIDPSILGFTISHPDVAPQILRRDRFAYMRPGEMRGSLGRNTFRKANIANWNAALSKEWHIGGKREWITLFRAEVYNLTNTPQFDEPQRNLTSPAFGKITNTLNDGRVLQLGLRVIL